MRILLSAYACSPSRGGEARLGFNWATQLAARGHEVWVITRRVSKGDIEDFYAAGGQPSNLHFIHMECDRWLPLLRRFRSRFRYLYYYRWQWMALRAAEMLHREHHFGVVHHATWVQYRAPSFMGRLGIPFIFGPVAGGESAPWALRSCMGPRQWWIDLLRDGWGALARWDPMIRRTYREATRILVASRETLEALPASARAKTRVQLAIAHEPSHECVPRAIASGARRFLFVGRFLGLKGMSLGLHAFADLHARYPDASLTMVGDGPAARAWRKLAERLGIAARVQWIDWLSHADVDALYPNHDVLLFPSLHDSGGLAVLEAMSHGLPVVCLKLGGPGAIVDSTGGIAIDVVGGSRRAVAVDFARALCLLADSGELLRRLSAGSVHRAANFTWDTLIDGVYSGVPTGVPPTPERADAFVPSGLHEGSS